MKSLLYHVSVHGKCNMTYPQLPPTPAVTYQRLLPTPALTSTPSSHLFPALTYLGSYLFLPTYPQLLPIPICYLLPAPTYSQLLPTPSSYLLPAPTYSQLLPTPSSYLLPAPTYSQLLPIPSSYLLPAPISPASQICTLYWSTLQFFRIVTGLLQHSALLMQKIVYTWNLRWDN